MGHLSTHHSYQSSSNDSSSDQPPPLPPASHHQALPPASVHQPLQIQHHHQQVPQQAASSATKELDELMASLSEFKVRTFAFYHNCKSAVFIDRIVNISNSCTWLPVIAEQDLTVHDFTEVS